MNFLFHLYLSGDDPDILTGNLMGDFVKGRIGDGYPDRIRTGIALHRGIDSFAQQHPLFNLSRKRIDPDYRLWRGVLVDVFYDHFLATEWDLWSREPLDSYLQRIREVVEARHNWLPESMKPLVPVIFDELLPSYLEITGIGRALERMSRRVRRPNPLAGAETELVRLYSGLRQDFSLFMPEASQFVADFIIK